MDKYYHHGLKTQRFRGEFLDFKKMVEDRIANGAWKTTKTFHEYESRDARIRIRWWPDTGSIVIADKNPNNHFPRARTEDVETD